MNNENFMTMIWAHIKNKDQSVIKVEQMRKQKIYWWFQIDINFNHFSCHHFNPSTFDIVTQTFSNPSQIIPSPGI